MSTVGGGRARAALLLLQASTALGAMAGGATLVAAPDGSLIGLPLDLLSGSVFPDYLVPGLALLLVIGVGHAAGTWLTVRRSPRAGLAALALGAALLIWIGVQVLTVGPIHWLQAFYALAGLAEIALAAGPVSGRAGPSFPARSYGK